MFRAACLVVPRGALDMLACLYWQSWVSSVMIKHAVLMPCTARSWQYKPRKTLEACWKQRHCMLWSGYSRSIPDYGM